MLVLLLHRQRTPYWPSIMFSCYRSPFYDCYTTQISVYIQFLFVFCVVMLYQLEMMVIHVTLYPFIYENICCSRRPPFLFLLWFFFLCIYIRILNRKKFVVVVIVIIFLYYYYYVLWILYFFFIFVLVQFFIYFLCVALNSMSKHVINGNFLFFPYSYFISFHFLLYFPYFYSFFVVCCNNNFAVVIIIYVFMWIFRVNS